MSSQFQSAKARTDRTGICTPYWHVEDEKAPDRRVQLQAYGRVKRIFTHTMLIDGEFREEIFLECNWFTYQGLDEKTKLPIVRDDGLNQWNDEDQFVPLRNVNIQNVVYWPAKPFSKRQVDANLFFAIQSTAYHIWKTYIHNPSVLVGLCQGCNPSHLDGFRACT